MTSFSDLASSVPNEAIPWVHAFTLLLTSRAKAPRSERDPAWTSKYNDVVNRIHDERLDRQIAERITDALLDGKLTESEFAHWIEEAKVAVEKYTKGKDYKFGRPYVKDTIVAKLKGFYDRNGYEWKSANGGEVGSDLFTEPEKPKKKPVYILTSNRGTPCDPAMLG